MVPHESLEIKKKLEKRKLDERRPVHIKIEREMEIRDEKGEFMKKCKVEDRKAHVFKNRKHNLYLLLSCSTDDKPGVKKIASVSGILVSP